MCETHSTFYNSYLSQCIYAICSVKTSFIIWLRPLNLGCCILPSKVASDKPFLSRLWTDLAENYEDFCPRVYTKFQPNQSTNDQDDATLESNLRQPKLKGRILFIILSYFLKSTQAPARLRDSALCWMFLSLASTGFLENLKTPTDAELHVQDQ